LKYQPNPKIFDQIAEKIVEQIRQGVLTPGAKVPSLRRLSRQLGVNQATVNRAYWKLESDRLLECRPQSGFYVREPLSPAQEEGRPEKGTPYVASVKQFTAKMRFFSYVFAGFSNPANLLLCFGSPGLAVLPDKSFRKSLVTAVTQATAKTFDYNWPAGSEPLKRQIARHYLECGLIVPPDKLILTSGASESLNVCFRAVTRPGDIVAVEAPLLPMMMMTLQNYHVKIVEIPIKPGQGMDLDYLKKALKKYPIKACLSMPNFNHPTGILVSDENKKRLVEMLAEKDAVLIENDTYGELYFGKTRPKPAKAFDKTGHVVLCSSFSKVLSPGIRVGWIIGRKNSNAEALSRFVGSASTNTFMEAAMADFMARGEYARHLRKVRKLLETNWKLYSAAMARYFPEGTLIKKPQGGPIAWVEFPARVDGFQLHREALEKNILIFPGQAYTLTPKFNNFAAIGFAHPWSESMDKVLKTLGDLAKKQLTEKQ
jgi:DNA-binding transcriptional MocR family regulator